VRTRDKGAGLRSERFTVLKKLGSGGFGDVYEAIDVKTGERVAVKTLHSLDADALYMFKNEFRSLADLRHPNLIRFGELCFEANQWFFTMELIEGVNFIQHVRCPDRRHPDRNDTLSLVAPGSTVQLATKPSAQPGASTFDEQVLRSSLLQLASALEALHKTDRVHRDIKPSNVLVEPDGRVVLLDFGLVHDVRKPASDARSDGTAEPRQIVGTPAYMAPEQIDHSSVGPGADWYSVGVLLFRALTGKHPFPGPPERILQDKVKMDAPTPLSVNPNVPPDLDQLCGQLLRREPNRRPTGREIMEALGSRDDDSGALSGPVTGDSANLFVGRQYELQQLGQYHAASAAAAAKPVVVCGDAGVGKSALVHRYFHELSEKQPTAIVLLGRCYEQESIPFRAFDTVIDDLTRALRSLTAPELDHTIAGGVQALARVFPVMRRIAAVHKAVSTLVGAEEAATRRDQSFRELSGLLERLARLRPLSIFIDDLQWADRDSLDLLSHLSSRSRPYLLVATMREQTRGSSVSGEGLSPAPGQATAPSISSQLAELIGGWHQLQVEPLTPTHSRELVNEILAAADSTLSSGDIDELLKEADGSPIFLGELARFARGHVTGDDRRGLRLDDVFATRIETLNPGERRLLEFVAMVGRPVRPEILAAAARIPVADTAKLVDNLRAAHLVRIQRNDEHRLVEAYHDRVREAIHRRQLSRHDQDVLEQMHRDLARALLEHIPDSELDVEAFRIVAHLEWAGHSLSAAELKTRAQLALRAAQRALQTTAYSTALNYSTRALAALPDDSWTADYDLTRDLHIVAINAEFLLNEPDRARERYRTVWVLLRSSDDRVSLAETRIRLETSLGAPDEAIDTARSALMEFGVRLPKRTAILGTLVGFLSAQLSLRRRSIESLAELPLMTNPRYAQASRLIMSVVPAAFFVDQALMGYLLMRMTTISLRHGLCPESAFAFTGFGFFSAAFGRFQKGYRLSELALRICARLPNPSISTRVLFMHAINLAPWIRPLPECVGYLERGLLAARQQGDRQFESYSVGLRTYHLHQGGSPLADLRDVAEAGYARSRELLVLDIAAVCRAYMHYCDILAAERPSLRDLPPEGVPDEELMGASHAAERPVGMFSLCLLSIELYYYFGDVARARQCIRRIRAYKGVGVANPNSLQLEFWAALIEARAAETCGPLERARLKRSIRRRLSRIAKGADVAPFNFPAMLQLARAEYLRIAGRLDRARNELISARAMADVSNSPKYRALAAEIAACVARDAGDDSVRAALVEEASEYYRAWGANAKSHHLMERSSQAWDPTIRRSE
jgi:predicted ATPase